MSEDPTPKSSPADKLCDACGEPPRSPDQKLLGCARCQHAWYHDKECQLKHYPEHKEKCRKIVTAKQQAAASPIYPTIDSEGQETLAEGIQVVDTDDLGRACVATQDFLPGDTVLLEPPAIYFDVNQGYAGLFTAFLNASQSTQAEILNMHRATDEVRSKFDTPSKRKIREQRHKLLQQQHKQFSESTPAMRDMLPLSLAEKLIDIVDVNAHAFQSAFTVDHNKDKAAAHLPRTFHALFTLGSKIEHSCGPNMTFVTASGKLECIAETKITKGERLSISYLGSAYEKSRKMRRAFLIDNKEFICKCARCSGYDDCAPLYCDCEINTDGPTQWGLLFRPGVGKEWVCLSCDKHVPHTNIFITQQLKQERELYERIRKYQIILQSSPYPEMLKEILAIVQSVQWKEMIHPIHWLNVEVYKLVSSVAASLASMHVKDNGDDPTAPHVASLLRLSAFCFLRRVVWVERTFAISRGLLPLTDATKVLEGYEILSEQGITAKDIESILGTLCDTEHALLDDPGTVGAPSAYHAGQDLLVAGHTDFVLKLYRRYEASLQRWKGISDQCRAGISTFLECDGQENPFGNYLLAYR